MTDDERKARDIIQFDALLRLPLSDFDGKGDPLQIHKRLLKNARIGINDPKELDEQEMKEICYALTVHYAQMGLD